VASEISAGTVNVEPGHSRKLKEGQSVEQDFGDGLALVEHESAEVEHGDYRFTHIKLDLHWARTGGATPPTHFVARLDGAMGQRYNMGSFAVSEAYPPQQWEDGELLHNRYRLAIPPKVPPGDYDVMLATPDDPEMALKLDRVKMAIP
jgi:hypothetical protein